MMVETLALRERPQFRGEEIANSVSMGVYRNGLDDTHRSQTGMGSFVWLGDFLAGRGHCVSLYCGVALLILTA